MEMYNVKFPPGRKLSEGSRGFKMAMCAMNY